jgi:putative alpha-1,2-mannosidase
MLSTKHGWRSKFSHQMEQAHPGYYHVYLHTHRVNVELSASEHVGAHKYQWDYPDRDLRVVIFHASYTLNPGACDEASVTVSGQSVTGFVHANGGLSSRFGGV